MTNGLFGRGGRRAGAGRKPHSPLGSLDERSRVTAALSSDQARHLFERACGGSFAAAAALMSLFRAAERLGLLPLERQAALERRPEKFFWLRRARLVVVAAPVDDLFPHEAAPSTYVEQSVWRALIRTYPRPQERRIRVTSATAHSLDDSRLDRAGLRAPSPVAELATQCARGAHGDPVENVARREQEYRRRDWSKRLKYKRMRGWRAYHCFIDRGECNARNHQ